jgi:uncharacterized protein YbjT (DUF2867 family)
VRFLVTGASGYVGQAVQDALVAAGHGVVAVSRSGRARAGADGAAFDLTRDAPAALLTEGIDGVLNLVGIIRENPQAGITYRALHVDLGRRLARAAREAGVPRLVQMSSLGVSAAGGSRYFATKWAAEQAVREAFPTAVIVRPSLVFGDHAAFFGTLAGLVKNPVVPVPGDGHSLFDPVNRRDLATLLAALLAAPAEQVEGQIFEVGGPRRMTLDSMVDWVAETVGRRPPVPKMHIPMGLMGPLVSLGERMPAFPLTTDQLKMLNIPNITDDVRWRRWVPDPVIPGGEW